MVEENGNVSGNVDGVPNNTQDTGDTTTASAPQTVEKIMAGGREYESIDKLVEAYDKLQSTYDGQTGEIGDLRKQVEVLSTDRDFLIQNVLGDRSQQATQQGNQANTLTPDEQLADISTRAEKGEIGIGEALRLSNQVFAQQADANIKATIDNVLTQRDAQSAYDVFRKENPDFDSLRNSGALNEIKSQSSMHDDFSAYFAYKAIEGAKDMQTKINSAVEEAKAKLTAAKTGTEQVTQTGLNGPNTGAALQHTNEPVGKQLSDKELEDSMLSAIQAHRSQS